MRNAILLLSLLIAGGTGVEAGQGAQPARGGLSLTVTDAGGMRLPGVDVDLVGPTDRRGETDANGQISFASLQPGTYRLRFTGEAIVSFEREVALAAGKVMPVDITLNRAPAAPAAPVATPDERPGPIADPEILSIVRVLEQEFIGRAPRQESLLSCSGTLRATMIQLNEPLPERLYDTADAVYYVVGGQGTILIEGQETRLETNDFASVPRGTLHAFERRGSRPLVLLALLGGAPCEAAR